MEKSIAELIIQPWHPERVYEKMHDIIMDLACKLIEIDIDSPSSDEITEFLKSSVLCMNFFDPKENSPTQRPRIIISQVGFVFDNGVVKETNADNIPSLYLTGFPFREITKFIDNKTSVRLSRDVIQISFNGEQYKMVGGYSKVRSLLPRPLNDDIIELVKLTTQK